jgi:multidrug efflux system outer membrane protein
MNKILLSIVFALILLSCNSSKESTKTTVSIPEKFTANLDTNPSFKVFELKEFYKDTILVGLIDIALKNNYDLKTAISNIEKSKAQFKERRFSLFPSLGINTGAGVQRFGDYTVDGVGNYDANLSPNVYGDRVLPNPVPDYLIGFESRWEVDLWGKLRNLKKSALANFMANAENKKAVQSILIAQVATQYYTLLALDKKLAIAQFNSQLQFKVLDLVKTLKEGGRSNELAVKQVQAQYLNTLSLEKQLEREILEIENNLNVLLGRFPTTINRAKEFTTDDFVYDLKMGVPSKLIANRPDIKQLELYLKASKADVNAARAAFLPSLNIGAFMGVQAFRANVLLNLPASLAYNVTSGLAQPIFNRYAIKATFKIKKQDQLIALYNYEKKIIGSFAEIVTHLNNIQINQSVIDYKLQEVAVLKEAVSISNILFLSGKANYIEVITSQKNVLQEEINSVDYQFKQVINHINLYQSIGGGSN